MALKLQKTFIISMLNILVTWASQGMPHPTLQKVPIYEIHEKWMVQFNRTYVDCAEKEKRFKIFGENYEYIERFNNAENNTYKLGINAFSDLTNEEFQASYTGLKVPVTQKFSKTTSFKYQNLTNDVPENVDWRNQGAVTPAQSQGPCGACWAFSAVAAVEGITKIKTGKLIQLSKQQLVDCVSRGRDCVSPGSDCQGGHMEAAFDYIIENGGITSESDYPYQGHQRPCNHEKEAEKAARIYGFEKIAADEKGLKVFVARQPISVYINTEGDFKAYRSGIYNGTCGESITHAVAIVGYGITEDGIKYWLLKNSWDTHWGENGYMRIIRESGAPKGACGILTNPLFPTL